MRISPSGIGQSFIQDFILLRTFRRNAETRQISFAAAIKSFEMAVQDGGFAREPASELVQSLAILADAVPPVARTALAEKLSRPSDWTETTLSQSLHKYAALRKVGGEYARRAMESMDRTWSAMLDAGATSFWEMKEGWPAFAGAGSLCHGWSAIPVYFYGIEMSHDTEKLSTPEKEMKK